MKLPLTEIERKKLRKHKIKIAELPFVASDDLQVILQVSESRAKELIALADFQRIPSVGIKFAEDLVFMGYHSIKELKGKNGALLREEFERKKNYRIDSCVEDQFRLAVYFAETNDYSKNWWDFTTERKKYRAEHGYPSDRPTINWYEVLQES